VPLFEVISIHAPARGATYFFSPEWSYDNEKELVVFTGSCYYNYKIAEIKMTFLIKNGSFNSSTFINGVLLSDYEEKKFLKDIYK